jgi:6-phosphogluconolactonase (cycloisomerase 2 family)
MASLLITALFLGCAQGALHHLVVGTNNGGSLYSLELDTTFRTVQLLKNNSAAGAAPSLALYQNKLYLYGIQASDATLSKYSVEKDFSINLQGTLDLPPSCKHLV